MGITERDRIQEEAARWYARLQAPDCSSEERAAFERWRSARPEHAAAFAAAERLSEALARLAGADSRLRAMLEEAAAAGAGLPDDDAREDDAPPAAVPARRPARAGRLALAAAVAAAAVAGVIAVSLHGRAPPSTEASAGARFAAGAARRAVTLEDGSVVHLDVGSVVEVRLQPERRDVTLLEGRALFDVAHDAARPFTVSADQRRVTALGTIFQVERTAAELVVTLAEGAVAVADATDAEPVRLAPGEELRVSADRSQWVKRAVDARAATSWSVGRHMFRATPLAVALADINRYAAVKVRLADPTLADLSVSGTFAAGDSEAIVAAFAAVLPLRVVPLGSELLLYRDAAGEQR